MTDQTKFQAVGRRKAAVARVWLTPGGAGWRINGRSLEEYFPQLRHQEMVRKPLQVIDDVGPFDVHIRVRGGGPTGQADAIRLAIARAILSSDEETRQTLRAHDLLTRDPRVVERKKPGRPKARKRFQFSKR
ncbi:MAG: 30S ribosomal protein S9 [Gemmatimonadota bacterium]|nr:30S ribosomal protein S9 [Gemmatimonadota bacterium]